MKILIGGLILLAIGCDSQSLPVITPQPKPKVDTIRVVDTVFRNDTVFIPERYVLIRSCVTGHDPYYHDTAVYNKEFPPSTTVYDSALLPRLREYAEKIAIRTVVRDTITFKDGKFFWPTHLCNCWGCMDSLRIERIQ
jgi:hypothetical protein